MYCIYRISPRGREPVVDLDTFEEVEPAIRGAAPAVTTLTRSVLFPCRRATRGADGVSVSKGAMARLCSIGGRSESHQNAPGRAGGPQDDRTDAQNCHMATVSRLGRLTSAWKSPRRFRCRRGPRSCALHREVVALAVRVAIEPRHKGLATANPNHRKRAAG